MAKSLINRRFNTNIPYQNITTDTTKFKYYVTNSSGKTEIKKTYLDPFLDMYNGEIYDLLAITKEAFLLYQQIIVFKNAKPAANVNIIS